MGMVWVRVRRFKFALIADFIDCDIPDGVGSALAVGCPSVDLIEALGADVAGQDPQIGVLKFKADEAGAGG